MEVRQVFAHDGICSDCVELSHCYGKEISVEMKSMKDMRLAQVLITNKDEGLIGR
jgi:hypothetical protein